MRQSVKIADAFVSVYGAYFNHYWVNRYDLDDGQIRIEGFRNDDAARDGYISQGSFIIEYGKSSLYCSAEQKIRTYLDGYLNPQDQSILPRVGLKELFLASEVFKFLCDLPEQPTQQHFQAWSTLLEEAKNKSENLYSYVSQIDTILAVHSFTGYLDTKAAVRILDSTGISQLILMVFRDRSLPAMVVYSDPREFSFGKSLENTKVITLNPECWEDVKTQGSASLKGTQSQARQELAHYLHSVLCGSEKDTVTNYQNRFDDIARASGLWEAANKNKLTTDDLEPKARGKRLERALSLLRALFSPRSSGLTEMSVFSRRSEDGAASSDPVSQPSAGNN